MALFWSKKPKAAKDFNEERKAAAPKAAKAKLAKSPVAKAAPASKAVVVPSGRFDDATSAIIRPRITEKSGLLSQSGIYTFEISRDANKASVAKAVKSLYKVSPVKVAVINLPSKRVFVKGRFGTVPSVRKAIVTVKKGEKIDFV